MGLIPVGQGKGVGSFLSIVRPSPPECPSEMEGADGRSIGGFRKDQESC